MNPAIVAALLGPVLAIAIFLTLAIKGKNKSPGENRKTASEADTNNRKQTNYIPNKNPFDDYVDYSGGLMGI
jgi:hypothetical protein